ncbi:hypothetical protein PTSG_11696 [Salpingoeca rosetta]|uniref:Uncharacterized protein n=1 Tax=Salpingoeca rosetta (strain ATCC 50818 / BSB-021) TaxID=946362 RepID=F2U172_SALR5|nr:uncharacterized protein PTSG_11696 [Salpingoeca rosetta]EGD80646.1 hypothetical protein PTSG_11696 [Salpingoeca rosetta]|eukprot:XP_004997207.1 hypothetical protein PTSG_11696 [Salpingoeca rosetta]
MSAQEEDPNKGEDRALPIKVLLLGEPACGKTALMKAFVHGRHVVDTYRPTPGLDFASKTVFLPDAQVYMHVWDFAGARQFQSLLRPYARTCFAVLLVYDVTDEASFDALDHWAALAQEDPGTRPQLALVGMKSDLADKRQVTREAAKLKALCLGAELFEVSVHNPNKVRLPFHHLAHAACQQQLETEPTATGHQDDAHAAARPGSTSEEDEGAVGWISWLYTGVVGSIKAVAVTMSNCVSPWVCSAPQSHDDSADDSPYQHHNKRETTRANDGSSSRSSSRNRSTEHTRRQHLQPAAMELKAVTS